MDTASKVKAGSESTMDATAKVNAGKVNAGKEHWIGVDLGGTKMLAEVFDEKFNVVGRCRKKTKGHEGKDVGLKRINAVIREALEQSQLKPAQITGLGIGCPGPLDLKKGLIREAPNLGWENVPIRKSIEDEFGIPVTVGNDVDFGVYGEYNFGAAQDARCVVGLFPGTGIGGGCVYEGRIFRGANSTCMEIGHIPMALGGVLDGAGNAGTLESIASRLAISGAAAQAAFRGAAPHLKSIAGTDIAEIRSAQLAEAIEKGDKMVRLIVETASEYLALGVVTMIHLLAPDVIVLGGGLVEAMPELFVETISKEVKRRVLPSMREIYEIVPAKLGDQATVMGAAAAARQAIRELDDLARNA
ncbi:MAG: ROK family protein [Planctomycetota bacterium]